MIKVKFNNSNIEYECKFRKINANVIHLIGDIPQNTNGFKAYDNGELLGDYSDYTTIYRVINGVQFSNNGSIWVEPDKEVTIQVDWLDSDDENRPTDVDVVYSTGSNVTVNIKASENWSKTVTIKESQNLVLVSAENVANYTYNLVGNIVSYVFDGPSWKEKTESQLTYTAMMTDTLIEE